MVYKETKNRQRINFLLPAFGMNPIGGFKIVYLYANYLAKKGYNVTIIHAYSMKAEYDKSKYLCDKFTMLTKGNSWMTFHAGVKCCYSSQLSSKSIPDADVTIATAWTTAKILRNLDKKKGAKIYLIQGHETWSASPKEVNATWLYDMRKIVISTWLYKLGEQLGATNMVKIPNALNFKKYRIIQPITKREKIICMSYNEDFVTKGAKEGIQAIKKVRESFPDVKVIFFGIKPKSVKIPKWVEYFENPKQETLVNDIYNKSSIFLCTSWSEGWGLPPMEAMACGCAVVTTANGGIEDFCIHEETALICPVHDHDSMAKAICDLVEDDEKRIRIATSGNRFIRKFQWKDSFEKFEQVIQDEITVR